MKKIGLFLIATLLLLPGLASAQDFPPVIDAEFDAWWGTLTGPSDGLIHLPSRAYLRDIGGPPNDDADCSGILWMAHDETWLYAYLAAKDDFVTASNSSRWLNDCIELKFDPNPGMSNAETDGTSNMRLTALGEDLAENPDGVDNINRSGHLEDVSGDDYEVSEDDYARRLTDDGYVLEFRVPRDYINEPEDGRFMVVDEYDIFGMAVNLIDNDSGDRDHMIQWSAGHTDEAHSFPVYHGSVTLLPDHKLGFEAVSPVDASVVNDSADVWYSNPNSSAVSSGPGALKSFNLYPNHPNPFNPTTEISYTLGAAGAVTLKVYDALGREIRTLADGYRNAGAHRVRFDASDLAAGLYFYRLRSADFTETRKMVLMK